ncbi:hypothetical protein A7982_12665 [Minicystis rosea]|nr:hypothetical protein A7982_12665 [Minicystis rosea]
MSTTRRVARIGSLLGVVVLGAAACQIVAGLDGDFAAAPEPDGGVDAGTGGGAVDSCMAAGYPDPPAIPDDADAEEIVVALRTIDLGESATVPPGYDLDHVCTCFADAGASCVSKKPHCDAPGGIDNASAQFFSLIQFAAGATNFSSDAFSAKVGEGVWSFVIRVRGYNGKADDPKVDVAMFPSTGTDATPLWNGTDAWAISATALMNDDLDQPMYRSEGAYVAQGTLVAAMPSVQMRLGGDDNTITLLLTGGVLTGTLSKSQGSWSMTSGVLSARWRVQDLFQAMSTYRDGNGKPICTDAALGYPQAKSALCGGLDILADPSGAKTLPCDALSIGIGFTAQEAKIGVIEPPPVPTPGCPPETDPATDTCPD